MGNFLITEHFYTIQGEGRSLGVPSYFIRFAGCQLNCTWCDSKHSSVASEWIGNAKQFNIDDINIPQACDNVIFTGGEPTLQRLEDIIIAIQKKYHEKPLTFEVETNGVNPVGYSLFGWVSRWNVSVKLSNTQGTKEADSMRLNGIGFWSDQARRFRNKVSFKFVVSNQSALEEVYSLCVDHNIPPSVVYLMTEGVSKEDFYSPFNLEVVNFCKLHGYNYTPRLHILLYGNIRGV